MRRPFLPSSKESISCVSRSCCSRHTWVGVLWCVAPALPGGSVDPFLCVGGYQETVLFEERAWLIFGVSAPSWSGPRHRHGWVTRSGLATSSPGLQEVCRVHSRAVGKSRITAKREPGPKPQSVTQGQPCAWTDGSHMRTHPVSQLPRALM